MKNLPQHLIDELHELEVDLDTSLAVIGELIRVVATIADERAAERLLAIGQSLSPESQQTMFRRLDALATNSDSGAAAKQLRSLTGMTWDEALAFPSRWRHSNQSTKLRMVRRIGLRFATKSIALGSEEESSDVPPHA